MDTGVQDEQFAQWIADVLRASLTADEHRYTYTFVRPERTAYLDKQRLRSILEALGPMQEHEQTVLYNNRDFEVIISEETRFGPPILFRTDSIIQKSDTDGGFTYTLTRMSDPYVLFLIWKVAQAGSVTVLRNGIASRRLQIAMDRRGDDLDVLSLLRSLFGKSMTLRIVSSKNRTAQEFTHQASSFLFQLTYNLDVSLVQARSLDDFLRSDRIARARRLSVDEIEAPKRHYIPDLTYHYQMAVATDSPLLEYLSYYHIAEHFFEQVFNEDLIDSVKSRITHPDFSYRRRSDIRELIKLINKRQRVKGESVSFSEQEALRLTLDRHVDLDDVRSNLASYDATLLDYYKTTSVQFSGGDAVDLCNKDSVSVINALSKRIYQTRNSIVHSKENERSRYVPFQHDRMLMKEVPLLRFIAESIIVKTSTIAS